MCVKQRERERERKSGRKDITIHVFLSTNSIWELLEANEVCMEPNYEFIQELFAQKVTNTTAASEKKKAAPTEVNDWLFDKMPFSW